MNKKSEAQDGWNEYSKLVLAELERLNENDGEIQKTLTEINLKLNKIESFEKEMDAVQSWKRYMEDVASPNTLKELKSDVAKLNTFKTVAATVWAIVQIGFGILVAILNR